MAKNGYHRKNVKQSSKANAGDAEAVFIAPNHIERIGLDWRCSRLPTLQ
jgi:hypothetical protein